MRRWAGAVAALVAILALSGCGDDDDEDVGGSATTVTTAGEREQCDPVAFTPDSEDMASDVTAIGVSCDEAEALVREAGSSLVAVGGPASLEVDGYRCTRTGETQDPIPSATYECASGSKRVTFTRT